MRSFAKRLIDSEALSNTSSAAQAAAVFPVTDKLRPHLATLMGDGGVRALLSRALVLATTEVSWSRAVLLVLQMRQDRYVPWIYWVAVVFLSIVGTLLTNSPSDTFGVSLYVSSAIFAVCLAITFIAWYRNELTLSIHDITTRRREAYYWAAILFTFALGTAAGDLLSEQLGLGYTLAGLIFGGFIALITLGYYAKIFNPVFAFWAAYILTRPLGASIGDYLTQAHKDGGLGLSTMPVSGAFLIIIIGLVAYLTLSGVDREVGSSRT